MMSQLREDLLDAIGTTYQQLTAAVKTGEAQRAQRALGRLKKLKERLVAAREHEQHRYLHVKESEQSCLLSRGEDGVSVVAQVWKGYKECEVTRFRSMEVAQRTLSHSGYVALAAV